MNPPQTMSETPTKPLRIGQRLLFGFFTACLGGTGGTLLAATCYIDLAHGAILFAVLGFVAGLLFGEDGLRLARRLM